MNKFVKHLILIASSSLILSGCSIFSGEEPVHVMAELPVFKASYEPQIAWSTSVGDGVESYYSQLQPVADAKTIYVASRDGDVEAFDLKTGKSLWSVDFSDLNENKNNRRVLFSGGLSQGANSLFVGTENGQVLAIDKDEGKLKWIKSVVGEVIARPIYADGSLVIHTSRGNLSALDATTGEEIWALAHKQPKLTLRGSGTPSISQGGVVYGRSDGFVAVTLLATGQPLWQLPIGRPHGATELDRLVDVDMKPVIFNGVVYILAYNGNLVAIDLLKGQQLWSQDLAGYTDLAISGTTIYLTDSRGHVFALNRDDGKKIWENKELAYRNVTGVAVANEYIVVGDGEGYLHWLSRDDGHFVAQQELDSDGLYVPPLEGEDYLYLQTRSGKLIAIEKPSVQREREFEEAAED
ncbi:MAG TPA: outer membrane protein assembly factor BamB [Psychromonas hadalis]|nr:outer membrane protein assembly factor BamB [Psychromonas hadalis]